MLLASIPTTPTEVRQILNDIRKDDLRASEVIRRLRELLRKREMQMEPIDLNEVVFEVLGLIQPESGRRGIVETALAANLPLAQGDKVHLQQILLNLVLNGMEAMADCPGMKTLTIHTNSNEKSVEVSVWDLGSGIAAGSSCAVVRPILLDEERGHGIGVVHTASSLVKRMADESGRKTTRKEGQVSDSPCQRRMHC